MSASVICHRSPSRSRQGSMSCQRYKGPEQTFSCASMWVLSWSVVSHSLRHHGLWHTHPHPVSSVHGISQAKIVEWDAFSSSRVPSYPGIELASPTLQADSLTLSLQGSYEETQGLLRGAEHSLRILNPRQVLVQSVIPWARSAGEQGGVCPHRGCCRRCWILQMTSR